MYQDEPPHLAVFLFLYRFFFGQLNFLFESFRGWLVAGVELVGGGAHFAPDKFSRGDDPAWACTKLPRTATSTPRIAAAATNDRREVLITFFSPAAAASFGPLVAQAPAADL